VPALLLFARQHEIVQSKGRTHISSDPGNIHKEVTVAKHFTLTANDQHQLGAYRADAKGPAKAGSSSSREIFGR